MKNITATFILLLLSKILLACPVCDARQPKILRGITHGTGPQSNWDYVIILVTVAIVMVTLFFTIKWLIKPGEKSDMHIKRFILNN